MSKYKIKYFYRTGDSFHTQDDEGVLEMEWTDLNKAKEALKRIKEHYLWYKDLHSWEDGDAPEPEWHKGMEYEFTVKVELDNGNEVQCHAPWCGYFEKLYSAKIFTPPPEENDMEISF